MRPPYELNQRIPRTPIDMKHFIKFVQFVALYTSYFSLRIFLLTFLAYFPRSGSAVITISDHLPGSLCRPKFRGTNSIRDTSNYSTAESYYVAARKRVGLLGNTLTTAQCFFQSEVYEMYSLRPLQAWASFTRACSVLQVYTMAKSNQIASRLPSIRSLEHWLYWSCLKSVRYYSFHATLGYILILKLARSKISSLFRLSGLLI